MGLNAGWLNVRLGDPEAVCAALKRVLRARRFLGEGLAATRGSGTRVSFAVGRAPFHDDAGTPWICIHSNHDEGYTPDPELALALATELQTLVTVCAHSDIAQAGLSGVVGPAPVVRAFVDAGASDGAPFWNPAGDLGFRNLDDDDEREFTFLSFELPSGWTPGTAEENTDALYAFFTQARSDRHLWDEWSDGWDEASADSDDAPVDDDLDDDDDDDEVGRRDTPPSMKPPSRFEPLLPTMSHHERLSGGVGGWSSAWAIVDAPRTHWLLMAESPDAGVLFRVDASGERPALAWYGVLGAVVHAIEREGRTFSTRLGEAMVRVDQRTMCLFAPDLELAGVHEALLVSSRDAKRLSTREQREAWLAARRSAGPVMHPRSPS